MSSDVVEVVDPTEVPHETDQERAEMVVAGPAQVSIFSSMDPQSQLDEAQARARVLVQLVEDQGLATSFGGGRPHVQVEGWSFLAATFGLMPSIEWTRPVPNGWEARAILRRLADGMAVAAAEGECRDSEANWARADSYAIRSMAQTRATSKVCRLALSSVMVLAGFSGTPTEEMTSATTTNEPTIDGPHCPACMAVHGTLVAVTGPHDRKPYWRCTARPADCGGKRTYQGKDRSWSGWEQGWEATLEDWRAQNPQYAGPMESDLSGRRDQLAYIMDEIKGTVVTDTEDEIKDRLKLTMRQALADPGVEWDPEDALGQPIDIEAPVTDEQLRDILRNLTNAEADVLIARALETGDVSHST